MYCKAQEILHTISWLFCLCYVIYPPQSINFICSVLNYLIFREIRSSTELMCYIWPMRPIFINFQPWKAEFLNLLGKNHLNKFNLCYWKPKCLNHQRGSIAKPILKILCFREISHNPTLMAGASLKTKPKLVLICSSKTNDFPLGRLELTIPV